MTGLARGNSWMEICRGGKDGQSSWWAPSMAAFGLVTVLVWWWSLVGLSAGCSNPRGAGGRCRSKADCRAGLSCSAGGVCYRPVDCSRLEARLRACGPAFGRLTRGGLLSRPKGKSSPVVGVAGPGRQTPADDALGRYLARMVGDHCRTDWANHFADTSQSLAVTRSVGQDSQSSQWRRCLSEPACDAFARCVLRLARWEVPGGKSPFSRM